MTPFTVIGQLCQQRRRLENAVGRRYQFRLVAQVVNNRRETSSLPTARDSQDVAITMPHLLLKDERRCIAQVSAVIALLLNHFTLFNTTRNPM